MRASLSPQALQAVLAGSLAAVAPLSLAVPAALATSPLAEAPAPAETRLAQLDNGMPSPYSGIRALNLARNAAVKLNGGLGVYRPASCMFRSTSQDNDCLISADAQGFLFRFLGGQPGWEQLDLPPTVETEILISPDGREVVSVIYNGKPRPPIQTEPGDAPVESDPAPPQS
ncbi:hypothetical protein [Synechococcus sp. CCY9202]|uniref:hypothetical protein n=1 Tax=Synechococcus sp. CCY9202 TaxID=174698 RepID=UPI002B214F2D|nr:hypothetical protein [Synechococcus sp. CCY9202]MEA5424246.1 hypothetical protein [Synechococcus sp. CCY9202]